MTSKNHKPEKCKEHRFELRIFGKVKKNVCVVCGFKQDIPKEKKGKSKETPVPEKSDKMSILKALKELAPSKNFTAPDMIKAGKEFYLSTLIKPPDRILVFFSCPRTNYTTYSSSNYRALRTS